MGSMGLKSFNNNNRDYNINPINPHCPLIKHVLIVCDYEINRVLHHVCKIEGGPHGVKVGTHCTMSVKLKVVLMV